MPSPRNRSSSKSKQRNAVASPGPWLPDLVAQTVVLKLNHARRRLIVAAKIKNIGLGVAKGPFKIDVAATLYRGNSTISYVNSFQVPANTAIYGQPTNAPALARVVGNFFSQIYVTDSFEVPLYYRDENPSSYYEFEFLVDSEQMVAEVNEANNHFFAKWWTTTPRRSAFKKPFIIEFATP